MAKPRSAYNAAKRPRPTERDEEIEQKKKKLRRSFSALDNLEESDMRSTIENKPAGPFNDAATPSGANNEDVAVNGTGVNGAVHLRLTQHNALRNSAMNGDTSMSPVETLKRANPDTPGPTALGRPPKRLKAGPARTKMS